MFIRIHENRIFIAEPSRKGSKKLLWSVMPRTPSGTDVRVDAADVPKRIRRQAYRLFDGDRKRAQTNAI